MARGLRNAKINRRQPDVKLVYRRPLNADASAENWLRADGVNANAHRLTNFAGTKKPRRSLGLSEPPPGFEPETYYLRNSIGALLMFSDVSICLQTKA